jgi:hypothetical protein
MPLLLRQARSRLFHQLLARRMLLLLPGSRMSRLLPRISRRLLLQQPARRGRVLPRLKANRLSLPPLRINKGLIPQLQVHRVLFQQPLSRALLLRDSKQRVKRVLLLLPVSRMLLLFLLEASRVLLLLLRINKPPARRGRVLPRLLASRAPLLLL